LTTSPTGNVPDRHDPDLLNPRAILRFHGIRPNKRLGQHFLTDRGYLAQIVAAADLRPTDTVLEVGPGLGVLTDALALRAGRVVAVEVDEAMRAVLASTVRNHDNVAIVAASILNTQPGELVAPSVGGNADGFDPRADARRRPRRHVGYKVVANLPYQITSAALRHILEAAVQPELAVVMVQAEVAERILAEPGDMSVLAVSVQYYATPSLVTRVPAEAFYPRPKVDSAVLRLDVFDAPPTDGPGVEVFFRTVRAGFGQKRKQLKNSLAAGLAMDRALATEALERAEINPTRRAETLSLDEWGRLAHVVAQALD